TSAPRPPTGRPISRASSGPAFRRRTASRSCEGRAGARRGASLMAGKRAFETDTVDGRNVQGAGVLRRRGERVISDPLLPFPVYPSTRRERRERSRLKQAADASARPAADLG